MWFAGGGGNRELRPLRHKMATSQKQEASKGERASWDTMGKNKLIVFIGGNTVSRWTMDTDLRELGHTIPNECEMYDPGHWEVTFLESKNKQKGVFEVLKAGMRFWVWNKVLFLHFFRTIWHKLYLSYIHYLFSWLFYVLKLKKMF